MRNSRILKCRTLVAGGGLYGCGFAASVPGALFVEENQVPGSDFLLSLKQYHEESFSTGLHPLAKQFQSSLRERNAYTETGLLRPGALAPELYASLLQTGLEVHLNSFLFHSGQGPLLLLDGSGLREVEYETFYDFRHRYDREKKFFHALIDFCGTEVICGEFPLFTLSASAIPGYAVLTIELDASDFWIEARRKLRTSWSRRPEYLAAGRIAWSGAAFSHNRYPGPVHAFDAGLREGEAVK